MPAPRNARLTVRLSKDGLKALDRVAERKGVSRTDCLEQLVRNADANPDGYYLRMSALNSWISAMLSNAIAFEVLKDRAVPVIRQIQADGHGVVGALPPPPPEILAMAEEDDRIRWLLEAYGVAFRR